MLRENGLSITGAEISTHGEHAIGSFYVVDAAGQEVDPGTVELLREEIGGLVVIINQPSRRRTPPRSMASSLRRSESDSSMEEDHKPRLSLAALIWSKLEQLSRSFSPIRL